MWSQMTGALVCESLLLSPFKFPPIVFKTILKPEFYAAWHLQKRGYPTYGVGFVVSLRLLGPALTMDVEVNRTCSLSTK